MISINNLSFSYGNNTVLDNISMELLPGNVYGLFGEHGVGKGKRKYYLEQVCPAERSLMIAVKKAFDIHDLFNPHNGYTL